MKDKMLVSSSHVHFYLDNWVCPKCGWKCQSIKPSVTQHQTNDSKIRPNNEG
jgi:hypothetical protein